MPPRTFRPFAVAERRLGRRRFEARKCIVGAGQDSSVTGVDLPLILEGGDFVTECRRQPTTFIRDASPLRPPRSEAIAPNLRPDRQSCARSRHGSETHREDPAPRRS